MAGPTMQTSVVTPAGQRLGARRLCAGYTSGTETREFLIRRCRFGVQDGLNLVNWWSANGRLQLGSSHARGCIATSHWSVVLVAGGRNTPESTLAMEQLCSTCSYHLYAHVRRRVYSPVNNSYPGNNAGRSSNPPQRFMKNYLRNAHRDHINITKQVR
jgi:hypothetical protein